MRILDGSCLLYVSINKERRASVVCLQVNEVLTVNLVNGLVLFG